MHFIIYGPEGSGKGTQATLIAQHFNLPVYTSGDLVREAAVKKRGKVNNKCKQALREGNYVEDEIMFELWKNKLSTTEAKKGFVLDGFPRNLNQARFLFKEVENHGYSIDYVIYLDISDNESKRRLSKRSRKLFEGSKVLHDSPHRIANRLKIYRENEKRLLEFFEKKGILLQIDAEKSIEQVFKTTVNKLSIL